MNTFPPKSLRDDEEIKVKGFSYGKYVCSLEMGDKKLDVGIKPEKRMSIKECEEKEYLTNKLNCNDIIAIMDCLLLQLVRLLKGNHPFLTVLSCCYLHNSSVINCNGDVYFFEKIFFKWIDAFCLDKICIDIFRNDNKDFITFMGILGGKEREKIYMLEKHKELSQPTGGSPTRCHEKESNLDDGNTYGTMCEDNYIKERIFFFFELFLIFYASSSEMIDYIITKNDLIHRDDYKAGLLNISDTLVHHCRKRREYILKILCLIKRCFSKFLLKYEETRGQKKVTKGGIREVGGKAEKGAEKGTQKEADKSTRAIFRRIKFILLFTFTLKQIAFETCDADVESIKENCKQLLKCVHSINKELSSQIRKNDSVVTSKYFSKYFLMHKLNNVSKHITKMSVSEAYSFYEDVIFDIQHVGKYINFITAKSSFFDIMNVVHYVKYYAKSCNVLTKCISRIALKKILEREKRTFYDLEQGLLLKWVSEAQRVINPVESVPGRGQEDCAKSINTVAVVKGQSGTDDDGMKGGKNGEKENNTERVERGNSTAGCEKGEGDASFDYNLFEKREDQAEKDDLPDVTVTPSDYDAWEDQDIDQYYSMFLNIYKKEELGIPYYQCLNYELQCDKVKDNIFISFFLYLFFNESYIIMEELTKDSGVFFIKNIIFNDLCYFGFSSSLLVLFTNFVHSPDAFFIGLERNLKMDDEELHYKNNDEYKQFLKEIFPNGAIRKFERKVRLYFPYLIQYMQKESSIIEMFTELEEFIDSLPIERSDVKGCSENMDNNIGNDITPRKGKNCDENFLSWKKNRSKRGDMAKVTKKRLRYLILCKVFNLFFEYLQIVLKKILKYSFLLPSREHSKLNGFHIDIRVLYTLMKILTYYFKLFNMNEEIESIEKYFNCILHTVLIDYNCLSLYINLQSDQEYAFTYYAMSLCYKELSSTLQKCPKLSYKQDMSKYIYSLFYFILYLYSDFLAIYFIYICYTNINSEMLEKNSFDMKYKSWNFCYPDISKIDYHNFQKNKFQLITMLLSKYMNTSKTKNITNDMLNITVKEKINNVTQIKENFIHSKKLVKKYSNLIMLKNLVIHKFRIFNSEYADLDITTYFNQCINQIEKHIKEAISYKYGKYSFIRTFLNSCKDNLIKCYREIPPFFVENISTFVNPGWEVVKRHPFFFSVQKKGKDMRKSE
ncbi:conserved Plasmodium protein, unknown function [Plasmodium ovale]|uniref:NAA35-like N-terminal domain-containing protein n=2 Tax=Plasmodium ovale TaxID=36330 RepID=A0A1A8VRJ5_PLAOA|nr:conserved Plasmodium protein, unknown function [Plasmodium ovale curtisi]SCQ16103.1 conserved Plasmodium protein, unknown function [Plasmodium ovale]